MKSKTFSINIGDVQIKLPPDLLYISIPIIDFNDKPVIKIKGTAFLMQYEKKEIILNFVVTALHCIRDIKSNKPLNYHFAFQSNENLSSAYLCPIPPYNDWIIDEKQDMAILNVNMDLNFMSKITATFYPSNIVMKFDYDKILKADEEKLDYFTIGFGEGLSSIYVINTGHYLKPIYAPLTNLKINKDYTQFRVQGATVNGFSGSPVIIKEKNENNNSWYIIGVLTKRFPPNERWFDDEVGKIKILILGGTGFMINSIWNLLSVNVFQKESIDLYNIGLNNTVYVNLALHY